jgi:adenylate cyclase
MSDPGRDTRSEWTELLAALGTPQEEIDAADTDEELLLLVIDRALGGGQARYNEAELAALIEMDPEYTRRLFRALGIPDSDRETVQFTDDDVRALRLVGRLRETGAFDEEMLLQLTRVTGSAAARIAESQVASSVEQIRAGHPLSPPDQRGILDFPDIFEVVWRRMLRAAARRRMAFVTDEATPVAVGFADLVGFTALSQQLADDDLAAVVDRFESTAYDVVSANGGRVVKMIGDEVMFAVDDIPRAVEIALLLSETYHDDESLSDVRVGLAAGPVLDREGDLYGPTVNLASRIVGIAYPGSVVVSADVYEALAGTDAYVFRSLRTRHLKDIGRVSLHAVRRRDDPFERDAGLARARRRRSAMRDRVESVLADRDAAPGA